MAFVQNDVEKVQLTQIFDLIPCLLIRCDQNIHTLALLVDFGVCLTRQDFAHGFSFEEFADFFVPLVG